MTFFLPLSTPIYYSIELTSQCNGNCLPCSNVFDRSRLHLSLESWQQILEAISPYAEIIKITGGEPTLYPQFFKIIQLIANLGVPFTIFTNARWSYPESLISFFSGLPSTFRGLLISLHGSDAPSHSAFTGDVVTFDEICLNIRRAADAGLCIHTSTVITAENYNRLAEVTRLSQNLGAKRAVFNRYIGLPYPGIEPSEDQLHHAVCDIENLHRYYNSNDSTFSVKYGNCIPQCFTSSASTGCWAGVAYCTIDPWGNLRPCNHSAKVIGNVLEKPIDVIWQNERMENWRGLLLKQCETCNEISTCHGGCPALIEIREKDPLIRQPIRHNGTHPLVELELYENSRPVLSCRVQSESFGYAMIRGSTLLEVTHQAKEVLDKLDGKQTLKQVSATFGQEAVNFIGSLYCYHLVEFL